MVFKLRHKSFCVSYDALTNGGIAPTQHEKQREASEHAYARVEELAGKHDIALGECPENNELWGDRFPSSFWLVTSGNAAEEKHAKFDALHQALKASGIPYRIVYTSEIDISADTQTQASSLKTLALTLKRVLGERIADDDIRFMENANPPFIHMHFKSDSLQGLNKLIADIEGQQKRAFASLSPALA